MGRIDSVTGPPVPISGLTYGTGIKEKFPPNLGSVWVDIDLPEFQGSNLFFLRKSAGSMGMPHKTERSFLVEEAGLGLQTGRDIAPGFRTIQSRMHERKRILHPYHGQSPQKV